MSKVRHRFLHHFLDRVNEVTVIQQSSARDSKTRIKREEWTAKQGLRERNGQQNKDKERVCKKLENMFFWTNYSQL